LNGACSCGCQIEEKVADGPRVFISLKFLEGGPEKELSIKSSSPER
jgi:hypothetical protein